MKMIFFLCIPLTILLSGCGVVDESRSYEVTKTGAGYTEVENTTVEGHVGKDNVKTITKRHYKERIRCLGSKDQSIPASTVEECIKKKGKVVDEAYVKEELVKK